VRRAAEYVALTLPPVGSPEDDAETAALVAPLRLGPRLPVPTEVPPGSSAHAAALAFPTPLLGLEAGFFFNGGRQMDPIAVRAAIAQVCVQARGRLCVAEATATPAHTHTHTHTHLHSHIPPG
jgi:hypothetical protein